MSRVHPVLLIHGPVLLPRVPMRFRFVWLTSQARYVRVRVSRRAMHASGDSPCHPSAKHHLLETCLLLMAPFRSMLLTPREWSAVLSSKGSSGTCILQVFPHSYMPLSRRTHASHRCPGRGVGAGGTCTSRTSAMRRGRRRRVRGVPASGSAPGRPAHRLRLIPARPLTQLLWGPRCAAASRCGPAHRCGWFQNHPYDLLSDPSV